MSDHEEEGANALRVEHVLAALDQIEELSRRVRRIIGDLDPKMVLKRHDPQSAGQTVPKLKVGDLTC